MLDYPQGQHDGRTGERRQQRYVCLRHGRVEHAQVVGSLGYDSLQKVSTVEVSGRTGGTRDKPVLFAQT